MSAAKPEAAVAAAEARFIEPPCVAVRLRDGTGVDVTPLKVREVQAFARAVAPLVVVLPELLQGESGPAQLVALLDQHSQDIANAVSVAARLPLAQMEELLPDELVDLACACLEVNVDFFRRALPGMQARGRKIAGLFSAGLVPSSS
jgi:hypothetical protein